MLVIFRKFREILFTPSGAASYWPGDAVLGGEGAGAGAEPGEGGQVRAEAQVQRDAGAVYPEIWIQYSTV